LHWRLAGAASAKAQDVRQADKDRGLNTSINQEGRVGRHHRPPTPVETSSRSRRWSLADMIEHMAAAEECCADDPGNSWMKSPAVPVRSAEEIKKGDETYSPWCGSLPIKLAGAGRLKPTTALLPGASAKTVCGEPHRKPKRSEKHSRTARPVGRSPLGKLDG